MFFAIPLLIGVAVLARFALGRDGLVGGSVFLSLVVSGLIYIFLIPYERGGAILRVLPVRMQKLVRLARTRREEEGQRLDVRPSGSAMTIDWGRDRPRYCAALAGKRLRNDSSRSRAMNLTRSLWSIDVHQA